MISHDLAIAFAFGVFFGFVLGFQIGLRFARIEQAITKRPSPEMGAQPPRPEDGPPAICWICERPLRAHTDTDLVRCANRLR